MIFRNLVHTFFIFLFSFPLFSQKMEVIRTKAVDRSTPITNVFVDADNQKWVGNLNGLYQVFSPDRGLKTGEQSFQWSLLQTHDGNFDLWIPLETLIHHMGDKGQAIKSKSDRITSATYNESKDELWIGTLKSGLFEFKTKPDLRLVKRHHTGNSKIPSNQVNTMLLDTRGQLWVGTYGGTFLGKDGDWSVKEKGFSFSAFAQNGTDVWTMGDNLLWKVNARGKWEPKDLDPELMEGDVADIAFDQDGLLWVVSEIVARVDPATEEATVFGPAIGFTSQDVYCVAVDQNNGVWIGTNDKGLYLIQEVSSLYVSAIVSKKLECNQPLNIAALEVNVEGGTPPYTYRWNNGATKQTLTGLGPGEYSLTITDSQGKTGKAMANVEDPNVEAGVQKIKDKTLAEPVLGSAEVVLSGSKSGYKFNWDNGESEQVATKLEAGKHSVSVTDGFGCMAVLTLEIGEELAGLSANISQTKNINCAGEKTASLKVETTGGKIPYSYKWNVSNFSGETIEGTAPGGYTVTVSDANGQTATAEITVNEPPALMAKVKVDASATTGNEDGRASVEVSGGTGKYQYKWSNGESASQAVKLGPFDHSVTVTDDAGCQAVASVKITEDILPLSVSISQRNEVKCADGADGSLEAAITGGKGPFRFAWSSGGDGAIANGLPGGNFTVTVTDVVGTTATSEFIIKPPKEIELSTSVKSPASTGNADGKATAKANGGTGEFTYSWSNGELGKEAVKLSPGEHLVTATDANGCSATASVTISENILALSVNISQTAEIKCAGDKSASIVAAMSGGKGPFTYQWSAAGLTSEKAAGLAADEYAVTVTDAVGNTATADVKIHEPQAVMIAAKVDAPASTGNADGKATANASGGTGKFSYKWDNGETTKTATKLAPGEHQVTVTDEAGCSGVAVVDVSENILPLDVSISIANEIKCSGESSGALKVEVTGGKGPFNYAWGQGNVQGDNPTGLPSGRYVVTVTDATGKSANAGIEINEPKQLEIVLVRSRPTTTAETKNGSATIRVSGGVPISGSNSNYTYHWDNDETGAKAETLSGGQHSVTVTDANGCTAEMAFETKIRIIPELSTSNLRTGATIKLNRIYFQPDSTNMDASSIPTVDELFEFLQENPNIVIEVGGHTNGIPSHEYCDRLSTERSKSVAQYLVDKGIPASQLRYKGYGKRKPVATNSTEEGRAKNQRVEIKVLEIQSDGG